MTVAGNVGKSLVGIGVGFGLYFLFKKLLPGGVGFGAGNPAEPDSSFPAPPMPPSVRHPDAARLTFVMRYPKASDPSRPMTFELRFIGPPTPGVSYAHTLEEMVSRIRAGGRDDVNLQIVGDVTQGAASAALDLLAKRGIKVWKQTLGSSHVSGNGRGYYGET